MKEPSHIILIDDDRAWLDTLSDFFEGKGYRVRAARESAHGLALLQSCEAGLAIVDFHMPEMNGLELLRRLRRSGRDLAVLMLSSDEDPTLPARALAEGARAFLSKTMTPAALLHTLLRTVSAVGLNAGSRPAAVRRERLLPVPVLVGLFLPVPLSLLDPRRN